MFDLNGKYATARIFTDNIENEAISQIYELCNQEFVEGCKVRIMPDVHAGKGCTIGTTMEIKDKVVPNLVGVDISCGVLCIKLKEKEINFKKLDDIIRKYIPSGMNVREKAIDSSEIRKIGLQKLKCINNINMDRAEKSLGTLGNGNHYLEIDVDEEKNLYLVIHSGSRYLGKQVAEYYQKIAINDLANNTKEKITLIQKLKNEGREKEIECALKIFDKPKIPSYLAYLEGTHLKNYLHDVGIIQEYANKNRKIMANEIITRMGLSIEEEFTTCHNYIDLDNMTLRKGAISAQKGEKLIIPINMRDGSIIGVGKGNPDWNYSAPHGAGRIMSRSKAKELVSLEEFKKSMSDVWTTSVCQSTIDESPMVYKPIEEIVENIKDTVIIEKIIKPVYNFKAN